MGSYIEQCDEYWVVRDEEGHGNALVLRTAWSSRYLDVVKKHKVNIIRLNEHTGWKYSALSFLLEIPGINGVDVFSERVTDISAIFQLTKLQTLSLFCKARVAGDFKKLAHLQSIALGWRSAFDSIFKLGTLRSINIIGYPDFDLTRWVHNNHLERLRLESRQLEVLRGIDRFTNIRQLHLYRCRRLQSLYELESSRCIQELRISHCGNIRDWSPIASLSDLRVLEIDDCHDIESVIPIGNCRKLERLQISGNTTILNGDLSSLAGLRSLRTVLLTRRKHYSHSAEELEHGHS